MKNIIDRNNFETLKEKTLKDFYKRHFENNYLLLFIL